MAENTISFSLYHDELPSQEVNELISHRPHWVIRKGIAVFLLLLLLILALTWFIRYPDIINGTVRLVAINAPKLLTAQTEGKLVKLQVTNEQQVQQGQILVYLQSTARHEQVIALQSWISDMETSIINGDFEILFHKSLPLLNDLGEIQVPYQEFQNNLQETLQLQANGYYQRKKKYLLQDLQHITAIQNAAQRQQQLLQQDFELQQIEFNAKESLAKDKIVAPLELNQDKSKIIAKKQTLEQFSNQVINNAITKHSKQKEILELQKYIGDQQQKFKSALLTLKSEVEKWMQRYIVFAPVAGKILFVSFLQENQLLSINQELFYIQPEQSQYYGELIAGQQGLGKIRIGQNVMMRIESYPSEEFGFLAGKISFISGIPTRKDSFLIKVDLPKELRTNFGQPIFFRNNLFAQAEIVTDNRRLITRFFGKFQEAVRR